MKNTSTRIAAGAIAGLAAFGIVLGGTAANAATDPANGNTVGNYVAVGSDTIQDLYGAFSNVAANNLDTFNAFGSTTITLNGASGPQTVARAAGSGEGAKLLSATYNPSSNVFKSATNNPTTSYAINQADKVVKIARSSSRPGATVATPSYDDANTNLVYVPLARDAVSVAIKGVPSITNLSTEQLTALYTSGKYTSVAGTWTVGDIAPLATKGTAHPIYVTGVTAGAISSYIELNPKLPQSGSGTRAFFQGAINAGNPATWVQTGDATTFPENDARVLKNVGDVIPFSSAQWIAQYNGPAATTLTPDVQLLSINGAAPFTTATDGSLVPGALYGDLAVIPSSTKVGTFNRDVYSVVAKSEAGFGNGTDPVIPATGLGKLVAADLPSNTATINEYGFGKLNYTGAGTGWAYSNWAN